MVRGKLAKIPDFATKVREVRFTLPTGKLSFTLYDLGTYDNRGQTALGYRVFFDGIWVTECFVPSHAVYGSPLHADDSDQTMASAIHLVCYAMTHDENDARCEGYAPIWDELDEACSLRWDY